MIANKSTIEFILSNHTEIINPPVLLLRSRACESRKKHEFFHRPTDGRIEFLERKEEKKKKKGKKRENSFSNRFEPIRSKSCVPLRDRSGREKNGRQRAALRCTTIVIVCRLSKSAIVSVYPWPVFAHWAVTVAGSAAPIGSLAAFPNGGGETITRLDVVLKPEFRLGETARGRAE